MVKMKQVEHEQDIHLGFIFFKKKKTRFIFLRQFDWKPASSLQHLHNTASLLLSIHEPISLDVARTVTSQIRKKKRRNNVSLKWTKCQIFPKLFNIMYRTFHLCIFFLHFLYDYRKVFITKRQEIKTANETRLIKRKGRESFFILV